MAQSGTTQRNKHVYDLFFFTVSSDLVNAQHVKDGELHTWKLFLSTRHFSSPHRSGGGHSRQGGLMQIMCCCARALSIATVCKMQPLACTTSSRSTPFFNLETKRPHQHSSFCVFVLGCDLVQTLPHCLQNSGSFSPVAIVRLDQLCFYKICTFCIYVHLHSCMMQRHVVTTRLQLNGWRLSKGS